MAGFFAGTYLHYQLWYLPGRVSCSLIPTSFRRRSDLLAVLCLQASRDETPPRPPFVGWVTPFRASTHPVGITKLDC